VIPAGQSHPFRNQSIAAATVFVKLILPPMQRISQGGPTILGFGNWGIQSYHCGRYPYGGGFTKSILG